MKLLHDFNDPRRVDDEGRLILVRPDETKNEQVELVEGKHVMIDGDTFEVEAVLELVEQFTSDGLVDTWRARIIPGSYRNSEPEANNRKVEWTFEILRLNDAYAVRPRRRDKGDWDISKERIRSRWDTYLFLRKEWSRRPDEIEVALNEADLAWYEEHKKRRAVFARSMARR
jgi:hypothetical protein